MVLAESALLFSLGPGTGPGWALVCCGLRYVCKLALAVAAVNLRWFIVHSAAASRSTCRTRDPRDEDTRRAGDGAFRLLTRHAARPIAGGGDIYSSGRTAGE